MSADALIAEGVDAQRAGDLLRARERYEAALALASEHPGAHACLGYLDQMAGAFDSAIAHYRVALAAPGAPSGLAANLATSLIAAGDPAAAVALLRPRIASAEGPSAFLHAALGSALQALGEPGAADAYRAALAEAPGSPELLNNLGNVLRAQGDVDGAGASYREAIAAAPGHAGSRNNLATLLQELGRDQEAEAAYREALDLDPGFATAHANLASLLEKLHRTDEARAQAEAGLALAPADGNLMLVLARCQRRAEQPEEALATLDGIVAGSLSEERRQGYLYERGRVLDRLGRAAEAASAFAGANRIASARWVAANPGPNRYRAAVEQLLAELPAMDLASWPTATDAELPVFLIGFPRSGTTLLDRILDAHPQLAVIEERPLIDLAARELGLGERGYTGLDAVDDAALARARERYWREVAAVVQREPGQRVVDKMPLNTTNLLLIQRLFPGAPLIVALRHPCDVVLSCYMQEFGPSQAMANFDALDDAAQLYDLVMRYLHEVEQRLPLRSHRLRYEDLLEDFEPQVATLLRALDLEWDDAVRDFAERARASGRIRTPSYHQVSQGLYRHAAARWQRYRELLSPVLPVLAPWADAHGYPALDEEGG